MQTLDNDRRPHTFPFLLLHKSTYALLGISRCNLGYSIEESPQQRVALKFFSLKVLLLHTYRCYGGDQKQKSTSASSTIRNPRYIRVPSKLLSISFLLFYNCLTD